MSNPFDHPGYEESISYSNDDYEPYGYASPRLLPVADAVFTSTSSRSHERAVEALLSQRSEILFGS